MRIHEVVASVIENQLWVVEPLVACCVLLWFCVGSGQHWTPQSWIDMVSISISSHFNIALHMGLSENSVPLHPMVNDHYPY
jgi:hypothetical protein